YFMARYILSKSPFAIQFARIAPNKEISTLLYTHNAFHSHHYYHTVNKFGDLFYHTQLFYKALNDIRTLHIFITKHGTSYPILFDVNINTTLRPNYKTIIVDSILYIIGYYQNCPKYIPAFNIKQKIIMGIPWPITYRRRG